MPGFASVKQVAISPTGWMKAIRTAIGMSIQRLSNKLNVSKQGIMDNEKREKDGSITIKSLRKIARAMDMQLVFGFIPTTDHWMPLLKKGPPNRPPKW